METIKNIQKISILFFAIFGAAYILSGLMEISGLMPNKALIVHQTTQIPFLISAFAYGGSSFASSIANPEKNNKILFVGIAICVSTLFAAAIILEILFPDIINFQ